jgi:Uma2 family endonuclease
MPQVLPEIVEWRKRTGADRYDEMWEGELHMAAAPNRLHQGIEGALEAYLRVIWVPATGGQVYHQINLAPPGGWPSNYRIPDLVLLLPDRFHIDQNEYFEGAPTAVVEIHSPGDETYDKLPFYAELGVPEVWVIHRDTKAPEVHVLRRRSYRLQRPTAAGWLRGTQTQVELMHVAPDRLAIRLAGAEATRRELPEY